MKQHLYLKITAMLAIIAVLCVGISLLTAPRTKQPEGVRVVTSFYPVYIAARNVVGDTAGVEVVNMVSNQFGCLHDYQMTPEDRVIFDSADVFVMNGAGAEPFLRSVLSQTNAAVIDLSHGQVLLESDHVHTHDEQAHDHEEIESANGHLWVSPLRYRLQVEHLCEELCAIDPSHAAAYQKNTARYIQKIDAVWQRMQACAPTDKVVLFHDSLVYLAEDLDLQVAASLNVGADSGVSASDLAKVTDALKAVPHAVFLYDSQYASITYEDIQSVPDSATSVAVDTCVAGKNDPNQWLSAMEALCRAWEATTTDAS